MPVLFMYVVPIFNIVLNFNILNTMVTVFKGEFEFSVSLCTGILSLYLESSVTYFGSPYV